MDYYGYFDYYLEDVRENDPSAFDDANAWGEGDWSAWSEEYYEMPTTIDFVLPLIQMIPPLLSTTSGVIALVNADSASDYAAYAAVSFLSLGTIAVNYFMGEVFLAAVSDGAIQIAALVTALLTWEETDSSWYAYLLNGLALGLDGFVAFKAMNSVLWGSSEETWDTPEFIDEDKGDGSYYYGYGYYYD